ncbi:MAG: hypothetical protein IJ274_01920 [Lachnospiraceae bacterium]|nr:hypothetical protein [Lachnospiraceae bacterium]
MKEKKTALHFTGRAHSRGGIISTVIAGIAWIIFAALCANSSTSGGNATVVVGFLGILDAFFVLAGMLVALKGFHERDVYYVLPAIGMVLNGILFVIYFSLYLMGTAIF